MLHGPNRRISPIVHTREILRIALPAIVSNITTPLLGLVDVAITGHLDSASYIGAIALGGTLFSTLYMLFGFLRMGTSGLTAQAFGASDGKAQATALYRALSIALTGGVLVLCIGRFLIGPALELMDGSDGFTRALAGQYCRIGMWGAPAVLASFALSGWFLGMQNSRAPMWMAIVTNLVNISVSVLLVYGLGWKIEGVAAGTVTAQWTGALFGLIVALRRFRPERVALSKIFVRGSLKGYFKLHFDIFLRTCCLVAVTLWFTHAGASAGVDILAANALLLQLFFLFSYFMDGFAFAGEAVGGKYWGAGSLRGVKSLLRELMLIGLGCAILFSAVYAVGGEWIFRLLSDHPDVRRIAADYLPWAVALPLCGFTAFVLDGMMIGLTMTRGMLEALFIASAVFFGAYFSGEQLSLANHGLWLAFDAYLAVRGAVQFALLRRQLRKSADCADYSK